MLKKCQYPGKLPEQTFTFTVNQSEKSYTFVKSALSGSIKLYPITYIHFNDSKFLYYSAHVKRYRNISIYSIVKFENLEFVSWDNFNGFYWIFNYLFSQASHFVLK